MITINRISESDLPTGPRVDCRITGQGHGFIENHITRISSCSNRTLQVQGPVKISSKSDISRLGFNRCCDSRNPTRIDINRTNPGIQSASDNHVTNMIYVYRICVCRNRRSSIVKVSTGADKFAQRIDSTNRSR